MHRLGYTIAGIVLAFALAGCGDSGVQEGQTEYKSGKTEGLSALREHMAESAKRGDYKKKSVEPKPAETKRAEKAQ